MILTERCTSLVVQRSQNLACTFVCAYGASALRPLTSMCSYSQLQKSGDASQYGWFTVSRMMRMLIGSAARPQWFSIVTRMPRFPPWSAISLYDSMAAFRYGTMSSFFG